MWSGIAGASLGGACGAARYEDEGVKRLREIMNGQSFPRWTTHPIPRFMPEWTVEAMDLCDRVIKNTQDEQRMSSAEHKVWRSSQQKTDRKNLPRQQWARQDQGWLDRKSIWDRPCGVGAVASIVIRIKGLQLKVDENGWVDRTGAASLVKVALWTGAGPSDGFKEAILDVVCSKSDKEGGENGSVNRVTCIFYLSFPAFMGNVANDKWIPRIKDSQICGCQTEAYLLL